MINGGRSCLRAGPDQQDHGLRLEHHRIMAMAFTCKRRPSMPPEQSTISKIVNRARKSAPRAAISRKVNNISRLAISRWGVIFNWSLIVISLRGGITP
jgi:hypothetical protein